MKLLEKIKNLFSILKLNKNKTSETNGNEFNDDVDNEELKVESNQHYKDMSPMKLVLRRFFHSSTCTLVGSVVPSKRYSLPNC